MEKILQPLSSSEDIKKAAEQSAAPPPPRTPLDPALLLDDPAAQPTAPAAPTAVSAPAQPATPAPVAAPATPSNPEATPPPAEPAQPPAAPQQFLTGSAIGDAKPPLPKGVYVIIGLNLFSFVASAADPNSSNIVISLLQFLSLMLCAGLFFRFELARKLAVVLAVLSGLGAALAIVGVFLLQARINELQVRYDQAVARIEQNRLTSTQRKALDDQKRQIETDRKQADGALRTTSLAMAGAIVVAGVQIVYLTRPRVRAVFHDIQK